jgi:hypothetical protein
MDEGIKKSSRYENKGMMDEDKQARSLYWYIIALVVPTLVYLAIIFADLVLHPLAVDISGVVIVRLLSGLAVTPLTIFVSILIMRRVPNNIIGPLVILWAANIASGTLRTDLVLPESWLAFLRVFSDVGWYAVVIIAIYFPTGRSHWKRYEKWIDLLCGAVLLLVILQNIPPLAALQPLLRELGVLHVLLFILAPLSMFLRYRSAEVQERQQMKWVVWGFALFIMTAIPFKILTWTTESVGQEVNELYNRLVFIFPAVTIGFAILRHKLYDIDIIIRRTLIYSVLSGLLALVFFGGVTVGQAVFRSIMGETSDLAIVVSTLAIAALFTPLRRRVQNAIDRRFYRRKYDAEQTLAQFAVLARDEVDVEKLKAALIGAVQETMQPRSVSVWVRSTERLRSGEEKT